MGKTSIEWAHYTFNPWWGCEKVSPGCQQCYAETDSKRYGHAVWGKEAPRRFFSDKHWDQPVRWNAEAERLGTRFRVFCASMADICEDRRDLREPRERLKCLIANTPSLDWLLLTKRPELYRAFFPNAFWEQCPNAWCGFTAEDQERWDQRHSHVLGVVASIRWVSVEPMLGPLAFGRLRADGATRPYFDWFIFGGESGGKARGCDFAWIRAGIQQVRRAGAFPFVKQAGSHPFEDDPNSKIILSEYKGKDMAEWPADLRIREFPR